MKLKDLLDGIDILEMHADPEIEISAVEYDSRAVSKGALFIAVRGFTTDGHAYIPAAVSAGAAAVLCEQAPELDVPYILCSDCRHSMGPVAANFYHHPASEMKVVGVTGTNGKTTTTTLIKGMLEAFGHKVGLIGTNQNMVADEIIPADHTTPEAPDLQKLFRRMADAGCSYAVMEVSSHALFLGRVDGIEFETGIFTNLTQDHLDFHGTMEEYLKAKAILFTRCRRGIVNLNDAASGFIMEMASCPVFTYAVEKNEADLTAKNIKLKRDRVEFAALSTGCLDKVELPIPGEFSVYNALAVMALGLTQGFERGQIIEALGKAKGVRGRVEVAYSDEKYTILIDYAHTPDALENVLRTVRGFAEGRTVVLFGCGGDRDRSKRPQMGAIAGALADFAIVTSDNPRTEQPGEIIAQIVEGMKNSSAPYVIIEDRIEAIAYAMDNARQGDVIVLAGKGHETYQIIGHEKRHLDEREVIAAHLEEKNAE